MKALSQKITLFFIALAACALAQPLLAKPYVKRQKQSAAVHEPTSDEVFRDFLRAGFNVGVVAQGIGCLSSIIELPRQPIASCCDLMLRVLFLKLYLTLAEDSKKNRDGFLSRFISRDGALSHAIVGGTQWGFGALALIGLPISFFLNLAMVGNQNGLETTSNVLGSVGGLALGVANCLYGAKKIHKAVNMSVHENNEADDADQDAA